MFEILFYSCYGQYGKESYKLSTRFCALVLIAFGILGVVCMGSGLVAEVSRVDVADSQKVAGAWCGLVALMTVPLVVGLHLLIPIRISRPSHR